MDGGPDSGDTVPETTSGQFVIAIFTFSVDITTGIGTKTVDRY